jgi:A/G-specific adenine glycosylase
MARKTAENKEIRFAERLLQWNRQKNKREMPWKGEKDPYKIWLSEIILQQTRVEQGLNYYQNFITAFPDIYKLANAEDSRVFKLWEGLGYYNRCKNLLITARHIAKDKKGNFPDSYEELIKLKGIGSYTAAAISSFAFNLPYAVVDGNVFRVIARVFGIPKAIDTTEGKKYFTSLANKLLDRKQPGIYNQAIMDFGATVCKPVAPLCTECIFKGSCLAFQNSKIGHLPVKRKKNTIKKRWFNYLVLEYKNEIFIHERLAKDIWQHLFEFYLVETKKPENEKPVIQTAVKEQILKHKKFSIVNISPAVKQLLSHQLINGQFIHIRVSLKPRIKENYVSVPKEKLKSYPFPKLINDYITGSFEEMK